MGKLTVEYMDLTAIKPYDNNPRNNLKAVAEVKESIKAYGWRQPIVVDQDMVIVVGHTRYQAAKELGQSQVPVHVAQDLTEAEIREYRIIDNASSENSTWDLSKLTLEMSDMTVTGDAWTRLDAYIEEMLSKPPEEAGYSGSDDVAPATVEKKEDKPAESGKDEDLLDMRGNSFYDGADGGEGGERTAFISQMTIGKKLVPMSEEEETMIVSALKKHGDIYGSYFGFVTRLLKGEYKDV